MLLVQIHKSSYPWRRKGGCFLPISRVEDALALASRWAHLLPPEQDQKKNEIRYISLLNIENDHPVALVQRWLAPEIRVSHFVPLSTISHKLSEQLQKIDYDAFRIPQVRINMNCLVLSDGITKRFLKTMPKIILGKTIKATQVRWTRLLSEFYPSHTA